MKLSHRFYAKPSSTVHLIRIRMDPAVSEYSGFEWTVARGEFAIFTLNTVLRI
jgi:hypothetical protein